MVLSHTNDAPPIKPRSYPSSTIPSSLIRSVSILLFFVKQNSKSYVFIFPSADDGSYIVERRNLSNNPAQGIIQLYVDELLLGSTVERTKLIFSSKTKVNSCFLRDNTLYLDLSDDLLSIEKS